MLSASDWRVSELSVTAIKKHNVSLTNLEQTIKSVYRKHTQTAQLYRSVANTV
jgi:hypothetical protein